MSHIQQKASTSWTTCDCIRCYLNTWKVLSTLVFDCTLNIHLVHETTPFILIYWLLFFIPTDKCLVETDAGHYFYINQGCLTVDSIDDKEELSIMWVGDVSLVWWHWWKNTILLLTSPSAVKYSLFLVLIPAHQSIINEHLLIEPYL